jgi:putative FmdB family regulatory protein
MAVYVYRCAEHGPLDVVAPMGTAPSTAPCPQCDVAAPRAFTAPRLSLGSAAHRALLDRTASTADTPAVVSRPPSRSRFPTAPHNPALARLPRP